MNWILHTYFMEVRKHTFLEAVCIKSIRCRYEMYNFLNWMSLSGIKFKAMRTHFTEHRSMKSLFYCFLIRCKKCQINISLPYKRFIDVTVQSTQLWFGYFTEGYSEFVALPTCWPLYVRAYSTSLDLPGILLASTGRHFFGGTAAATWRRPVTFV
jgi:hypothetical protein